MVYSLAHMLVYFRIQSEKKIKMWQIVIGVFLVLHGLVHLLYLGHSARLFKLQPEMTWPDGSWAFSRFLGDDLVRSLAGVSCGSAAIGFVVGGIGLFAKQAWWRPTIITVAIFSSAIYILFWDAGWSHLDNKGGVGILINLAILVVLLVFRWPNIGIINK